MPYHEPPKKDSTVKQENIDIDFEEIDDANIEPYFAPRPNQFKNTLWEKFGVTTDELIYLLEFRKNLEARNTMIVFMLGVLFMPVTLAGALIGYARGYNRFFRFRNFMPGFYPMYPIIRVAMVIGAIVAWLAIALTLGGLIVASRNRLTGLQLLYTYLAVNTALSSIVYLLFRVWRAYTVKDVMQSIKFGSAHFADESELDTLRNTKGFYIGKGHLFNDSGHILTVAGTRGGKGTNIIIPNLLGAGNIETSWVVIDPKGENAAISANYQRSIGKNVVVLNPWELLAAHVGEAQTYNPLDMLNIYSLHLVDDIQVIAEMIVPIEPDSKDKYWADSARTIISGLILHLVTSRPKEDHTLGTIWEWARMLDNEWDTMVQDMCLSTHPIHYLNIRGAGRELLKLQGTGDETFGGIISNVLQATDFLKSTALQNSLQSQFDPKTLVKGNAVVYVIIPADKLRSHGRWLRLIVTSMLRAVIRNPEKRVTFLLDEFSALGYLPEIETALSTYAGYNVTIWPILQSLIQLKNLYKDNWETFIANCTVRQYFTINDNFSADYISAAIGETSNMIKKKGEDPQVNKRLLVTPDELRRESGKKIFMFIADLPPTYVDKLPYYKVPELDARADENPYRI